MARRAMTSGKASQVKVQGHVNERQFAALVGGRVSRGKHTDKKDVLDQNDGAHSVKAGDWWQIFLYGRERFASNTIFKGLGNTAGILVDCIDAFPEDRDDFHGARKDTAKQALQPHMRSLLAELQKPYIGPAFFDKAVFDGGSAEYLSVYPGPAADPFGQKKFHIFHKEDVIKALMSDVTFANSKARNALQMSDQKVVLKSSIAGRAGRQIGEIELRNESKVHYRQAKFRLRSEDVMKILQTQLPPPTRMSNWIYTYGKATSPFNRQNLPQTLPQTLPPIPP